MMPDQPVPDFSLPATGGKTFTLSRAHGIEHLTFALDAAGILRGEWRAVKAPGHPAEVLEFLKSLKKTR